MARTLPDENVEHAISRSTSSMVERRIPHPGYAKEEDYKLGT
jgi:hypothetical protein